MSASNTRVALVCGSVVAGMVGLTAASVPLYNLFCQVTGYGGTTQRAEAAPGAVSDVEVTVYFNADIAGDMPWRFQPAQRSVKVRLGEEKLIFYTAENLTDRPIAGTATFNVTPFATGP
jgi:cytochrome c oxidase assembly protein subunit 11